MRAPADPQPATAGAAATATARERRRWTPCDDLRALPLRARKRERARRHVEAVALRLFAEQGYEATTVQQIAEVAEVGPRSFFRYFASKEDVLLGDVRRLAGTLPDRLRVEGALRPADAVGGVLRALGPWPTPWRSTAGC